MTHRRLLHALLALGALLGPALAQAADAVKIGPVARYENSFVATAIIRDECDWNRVLVNQLVKSASGGVEVVQGGPPPKGRTLDLYIHHVDVSTKVADGWSSVILRGVLREDGKLVARFQKESRTMSKWSACGALTKMGEQLGIWTNDWLELPLRKQKSDPWTSEEPLQGKIDPIPAWPGQPVETYGPQSTAPADVTKPGTPEAPLGKPEEPAPSDEPKPI